MDQDECFLIVYYATADLSQAMYFTVAKTEQAVLDIIAEQKGYMQLCKVYKYELSTFGRYELKEAFKVETTTNLIRTFPEPHVLEQQRY